MHNDCGVSAIIEAMPFDEYVTYDNSVRGIQNINKGENKGDKQGSIIFYRGGKELKRQAYKEFLKKYPNFK